MSKITLSNIKSFIEGNFNFYLDKMGMYPDYKKEQIIYRLSKCEDDCLKQDSCVYCGCPPKRKVFANKSCNNGERFPDMLNEKDWEEYKINNNVQIFK